MLQSPFFGLILLTTFCVVNGKEDSGYVTVRPGAHMFWWLHEYTGSENYKEQPLIMWLQGGPGAASSGYGNFWEIGPLDINLNPRKYSWVEKANILFVDQPVGTGYSYVESIDLLTKTNLEIADDLVRLSVAFFKTHPEFQSVPFYIFGESYGGKMAISFALDLKKAIQNDQIQCNLKGVALVDSWISPLDSVHSWAPYLYSFSFLDELGVAKVQKAASRCQKAFDDGQFGLATNEWQNTEQEILKNTNLVNFYNVMTEDHYAAFRTVQVPEPLMDHPELAELYLRHVITPRGPVLNELMNGPIKKKLNIPAHIIWGHQSGYVFNVLAGDFMKPVIDEVDELLISTDVEIIVINGQLDLIVDTLGTNMWLQKLNWNEFSSFNTTERLPISIPSEKRAGFVKSHKALSMYYIMKAGHVVPGDAPETSYKMLEMILFGNHRP